MKKMILILMIWIAGCVQAGIIASGSFAPNGDPSNWGQGTSIIIGDTGEGYLEVNEGSLLRNIHNVEIGYMPGSSGKIVVDGIGSSIITGAELMVGLWGSGDLERGKSAPAEDRGERDSYDPGGGRDEPGRTRPTDILSHTGAGTPGVRCDRRRGHRDRHPCDRVGGWCSASGCRPPRECGRGGRGGGGRNRAHNRG